MTVKEMHIGVNLLLQKVNSNYIDSFEPEEIDWALNEEVLRFIKQRRSNRSNDKQKGFLDGQKRFDDLKPLITPASLPCYVRDNNSVFSYLPHDYLTLDNDRTITKDLCKAAYQPTTSLVTKYIYCIQIEDDVDLYQNFRILFDGVEVFNINNYPAYATGLQTSAKFQLINLILEVFIQAGYICKYRSYYDVVCPQGIILVTDTQISVTVEYDNSSTVSSFQAKDYTRLTPVVGNEVSNRLTGDEDLFSLLTSSFGDTIASDPLSTLEGDKIIVFHKRKFIASTINISYLRKPRKINLSLNQDCDLDDWIQQEVVDNTAKRLSGVIGAANYKELINENLLKE
jgi:hypothetical protein